MASNDGIGGSNLNFFGNSGVITVNPGTLKVSRTGSATCTATYKIKKSNYLSLPGLNSLHPIFTFISLDNYELALEGAFAVQTANYAGVQSTYDDNNPTYELIIGLSEEPIETHPKAITDIIGTAKAPKNGAIFEKANSDGSKTVTWKGENTPTSNAGFTFRGFLVNYDSAGDSPNTNTLNLYAKLEHYLEASQITWRRTTARKASASSVTTVGKIAVPKGPAPALGGSRNWLYMGLTQTQKGSVYNVVEEWRASGRRGWISSVYGPSS